MGRNLVLDWEGGGPSPFDGIRGVCPWGQSTPSAAITKVCTHTLRRCTTLPGVQAACDGNFPQEH